MAVINVSDLTTKSLTGDGVFDQLMETVQLRLKEEFDKNRIKGADYSKVFLGAMDTTMQQSLAYLLGVQQADKQAELLDAQRLQVEAQTLNEAKQGALLDKQIEKMTAEIALLNQQLLSAVVETANLGKVGDKLDAETASIITNTSLTNKKIDAVVQDIALSVKQEAKIDKDILAIDAQITKLGKDGLKTDAETGLINQNTTNAVTQGTVLTSQKNKLDAEKALLEEKTVTESAQTRSGIASADSVVGRQTKLYERQADGFLRDAEQKAAKIFGDAYSVQRSTDKALSPPDGLNATKITSVMDKLAAGVNAT